MMTRFYKVLVISIDVFASKIIDERHFPDYIHATSYADAMKKTMLCCRYRADVRKEKDTDENI